MADRAVIPLAPLVLKSDDLLIFALFEDLCSDFCSSDNRTALSHVFSVGKQKYITECGSFARFNVEQIDIERVALRDAKLSATSSDDCVSHSLSEEKKPPKIPQVRRVGKQKPLPQKSGCSLRCLNALPCGDDLKEHRYAAAWLV
jgi:hypothetical protein